MGTRYHIVRDRVGHHPITPGGDFNPLPLIWQCLEAILVVTSSEEGALPESIVWKPEVHSQLLSRKPYARP